MGRRVALGVAALLAACVPLPGAEGTNLARNGGFEQGLDGWQGSIRGELAKGGDAARIVAPTGGARTGKRALRGDTTALNPAGRITDDLRQWQPLKYEVVVTTEVPAEANAWYLATFHVRSPGIAVASGLELLADIRPWPLRTYGRNLETPHWKAIHAWERRLFLPQAPRTDDAYHEHVLLKRTYRQTTSLAVGLLIRAPWTGTLLSDDVQVRRIDPSYKRTRVERHLKRLAVGE